MIDRWNTPLDDFEGMLRKMLVGGLPAPETLPSEPPVALIQECQTASQAFERLAEHDLHLHFEIDDAHERMQIQMIDKHGRVIGEVSPLKLLESLPNGCDLLLDAGSRDLREPDNSPRS
jgi:hypothetical protein